jgi:hypothetical protein
LPFRIVLFDSALAMLRLLSQPVQETYLLLDPDDEDNMKQYARGTQMLINLAKI